MAVVELKAGARLDMLTKTELDDSLKNWDPAANQKLMAKWMRYPKQEAAVAGGALSIRSEINGGPRPGYSWSVMRLVVTGLAATDVVGLYRGDQTDVSWSFNGSSTGYFQKFSKLELVLTGGEWWRLANIGALTATGVITLTGEVIEVPTPLLGILA